MHNAFKNGVPKYAWVILIRALPGCVSSCGINEIADQVPSIYTQLNSYYGSRYITQ